VSYALLAALPQLTDLVALTQAEDCLFERGAHPTFDNISRLEMEALAQNLPCAYLLTYINELKQDLTGMGTRGVVHSGFMTKIGHIRKNFKRRYFVLRGDKLTYHEPEVCFVSVACLDRL